MITVVSTPTRTVNGITSNVVAARAQALFQFSTNLAAEENYKINIRILDENDVALITTTFKYSVKPDGTVNVDLGRIVTEINEAGGALSIRFKIGYSETYTGTVGAETIIGEWLAVYGEKQILSEGGANMAGYLLNDATSKQASVFENPVYWEGFSRRISIVMDSDFATRTGLSQYRIKNVQYDINKNITSTEYGAYITDLTPRLDLDFITGSAPYIGASIDGLTEEMIHERRTVCKNPILIDWLNSKGGVDQWIFEVDQIYEREAGVGLSYQSAISGDIDSVFRTKFRQSPKWTQQVIMKAENLTLDQLKALQEIKSSISVRAQLNLTGSEWVGVVCSSKFSTIHNSGDDRHEFTLQIEFPDNFDFNNAVDYTVPIIPATLYEDASHIYTLFRATSSQANDKCVRIRRSSDDTEADVFFNNAPDYSFITLSNTVVEVIGAAESTLGAWVGANDAFVTRWYNQIDNSEFQAVENTTFTQQKILVTGSAIHLKNGTPAIDFDSSVSVGGLRGRNSLIVPFSGFKPSDDFSILTVTSNIATATFGTVARVWTVYDGGASDNVIQMTHDSRSSIFRNSFWRQNETLKGESNMLLGRVSTDQLLQTCINKGGVLQFTSWDNNLIGDANVSSAITEGTAVASTNLIIGTDGGGALFGDYQLIILFKSDKTADRVALQTEIISKLSIPTP